MESSPVKQENATPRKRPSPTTPQTPTPKKAKVTNNDNDAGNNSSSSKKAKSHLGAIPSTPEEASLADKLILRLRDHENRNWPDINKAWSSMTGCQVGGSTLRMRYTTMKANFRSFTSEDEKRLLKFKKEAETRFETEKWASIAQAIHADGGEKYTVAEVVKKFKQLEKSGAASGFVPAPVPATENNEED